MMKNRSETTLVKISGFFVLQIHSLCHVAIFKFAYRNAATEFLFNNGVLSLYIDYFMHYIPFCIFLI